MCELVEERKGFGVVGFQFRYEPPILALRKALSSGLVGRIERVDVSWMTSGRADPQRAMSFQHDASQGGGVANAFLSHVIDYLSWLIGVPLSDVRGRSGDHPRHSAGLSRKVVPGDRGRFIRFVGKCGNTYVSASVSNCVRVWRRPPHFCLWDSGRLELSIVPPFGSTNASLRLNDGAVLHELPIEPHTSLAGDSRTLATAKLWSDFFSALNGGDNPFLPRFRDGLTMWKALGTAKNNVIQVV